VLRAPNVPTLTTPSDGARPPDSSPLQRLHLLPQVAAPSRICFVGFLKEGQTSSFNSATCLTHRLDEPQRVLGPHHTMQDPRAASSTRCRRLTHASAL
jgi:hypothetical protein